VVATSIVGQCNADGSASTPHEPYACQNGSAACSYTVQTQAIHHACSIHTYNIYIYIYIHVCVYIYIHIRTYMRVCKYNYAHLYIHAGVVDSTDVEYTHATGTVHSHGRICREKRSIVKQCGNTSACKAPMYANTNKVPEIQAGGVYMCWCICLRNMSGSANHLYEHTCMHVHSTAMCSPIVAKTGNISMKCRAL
jgi:hypothetical protein